MDAKSKFFLRSRKIQAALIIGLQAAQGFADAVGVAWPKALSVDWLAEFLNSITADSGTGAALINTYAVAALVWSQMRPDGAKLTARPAATNAPFGDAGAAS